MSAISLPRINNLLQTIQQQRSTQGDIDSYLPLQPGVLYTFNGTTFTKANRSFATKYGPGQIDNGFYYVVWPEGVAPELSFLLGPRPIIGAPRPGDLCYLWDAPRAPRIWWQLPAPAIQQPPDAGPAVLAAHNVASVYPRLMASTLRNITSLNQLTDGWQLFQTAVKSNLIADNGTKTVWTQLPTLAA